MRSVLAVAVVACALLAVSPLAHAQDAPLTWGASGHSLTGAIAQGFLTQKAQNALVNLLPESGGDMARVASWADTYARDAYPWSTVLHYADAPDWQCSYNRQQDCHDAGRPGFCVDVAIQNFTSQLVAGRAPLGMNVALKFLIHFVGDIHQPLHVGFQGDQGGNTLKGVFVGKSGRKLHQIWDSDMVEKRIKDDFQGDNDAYLAYYMDRLRKGDWSSQVSSWRSCPASDPSNIFACTQAWATQSASLACSTAYTDERGIKIKNGFNLPEAYYRFALPVVEMQVARAGIRLANVVNAIFSGKQGIAQVDELTEEPEEFERRRAEREIMEQNKGVGQGRINKMRFVQDAAEQM